MLVSCRHGTRSAQNVTATRKPPRLHTAGPEMPPRLRVSAIRPPDQPRLARRRFSAADAPRNGRACTTRPRSPRRSHHRRGAVECGDAPQALQHAHTASSATRRPPRPFDALRPSAAPIGRRGSGSRLTRRARSGGDGLDPRAASRRIPTATASTAATAASSRARSLRPPSDDFAILQFADAVHHDPGLTDSGAQQQRRRSDHPTLGHRPPERLSVPRPVSKTHAPLNERNRPHPGRLPAHRRGRRLPPSDVTADGCPNRSRPIRSSAAVSTARPPVCTSSPRRAIIS